MGMASTTTRYPAPSSAWTGGGGLSDGRHCRELLAALLAEIEDDHVVRVELVTVGDAPLDDRLRALALAGREAAANAAQHAGVATVDAYLEVEPHQVTLFVRDRGQGFDVAQVDPDRRGLTESIQGRMVRAGGWANVRSAPGEGTEVELVIPRPA